MKGSARKGMCKCGHLRWKDHSRTYEENRCIELYCKKCDCEGYVPASEPKKSLLRESQLSRKREEK